MELTWYGLSCFRVTERKVATVVTDPYDVKQMTGALKLKGDIVTVSGDVPGHNNMKAVTGKRKTLTGPGEYEIGGVFITGVSMDLKNGKNAKFQQTSFVLDYDGLRIAHLGNLSEVPSQSDIEDFGTVDIALVPVGGGGGLTSATAAEVVSLLEPSIVVPMQYSTGKEKVKLNKSSRFLSEMGVSKAEAIPSLKTTKRVLTDETQVVVLNPAR